MLYFFLFQSHFIPVPMFIYRPLEMLSNPIDCTMHLLSAAFQSGQCANEILDATSVELRRIIFGLWVSDFQFRMHFINSTEGDFVFNLFGIHTLHSTVPPEHLAAEFALKILINAFTEFINLWFSFYIWKGKQKSRSVNTFIYDS